MERVEGAFELVHETSKQRIRSVDMGALFSLAAFVGYAGAILLPDEISDPSGASCPIRFMRWGQDAPLFETFGTPPKMNESLKLPGHSRSFVVSLVMWTYEANGARSAQVYCEGRT